MGEAVKNLEWIKDRTTSKVKFDMLSDEEKKGIFPLGVLHKDEEKIEYTKAYDKVRKAAMSNEAINFEELA